jgi:hypothetical protein
MSNAQQVAYDSAATMRRSMNNMQSEMNEFKIAAMPPRDEPAMERARSAAHAYMDAYFDALATGMLGVIDGK